MGLMNIRQEGLGTCQKCGTPIMQAINQPGIAGLCFGCSADAEPKTGRTVVVTETQQEKAQSGHQTLAPTLSKIEIVDHTVGKASALPKDPDAIRKAIAEKAGGNLPMVAIQETAIPLDPNDLTVQVSIAELEQGDCLVVLLQRLYDALDNSSFTTIKEAKRVMSIQEAINKKIKKIKGGTE
jgi:hypothetical protein